MTAPAMVPLEVTARLQQGVALDARFGTALDGLLAGLVRREQLGAAYGLTDPADPTVDPDDLELPLSRCAADGHDWHWMATCARPAGPWLEEVHYWTKRLDHRQAELACDRLPRALSTRHGRYRTHRRPLVVTVTQALTWRAVGDPAEVTRLLEPVGAIGAHRARGEGAVLGWRVTPVPAADPDRFGHLGDDGRLARPCPPACAARLGLAPVALSSAGIRPPYWHPRRQRRLAVPELPDPDADPDTSAGERDAASR